MQNPSRRAFLRGKTPEISQWDQFLLQLQRKTQIAMQRANAATEQVQCTPSMAADVHHIRQLCQTFGVQLRVGRLEAATEALAQPELWLDMSALNQLMPIDPEKNQWFIQPGVQVAQLKEAGFNIPSSVNEHLWVTEWLGQKAYQNYTLAQVEHSGIVHASMLMSDGTTSSLGPFGAQNTKPLNTPLLRQLVPQLYELAQSELVQQLMQSSLWPAQYRLDLFTPQNHTINLAHLLLGSANHLGLMEWVVMDKRSWRATDDVLQPLPQDLSLLVSEVDAAVKALFDPESLFASSLSQSEG